MLSILICFLLCVIARPPPIYAQFNPVAGISFCPRVRTVGCNPNQRYSEIDGSCNNLATPWVGKAFTPYKRYLFSAYDDGRSVPRIRAVNGFSLPNPRVISRTMSFIDNGQSENFYTHLTPLFGQFVAHDISNALISTDSNGSPLNCNCASNSPDCFSVSIPSNDNIMRQSCMRFTRSQDSRPFFDCGLTSREPLNSLSSFIDGSQIYGFDSNRNALLRARQQGLLKASQGIFLAKPYLPRSTTEMCGNFQACFLAGETRTNNNLGLVGIQVLFMREHNRIAMELSAANPTWNDESVYQETRKIVIGILQHIIYNEWLPTIIGAPYASLARILPIQGDGYFTGYDSNTNPTIANEFSAAAFRFGHTLVRQRIGRFTPTGGVIAASLNVSQIIFRADEAFNAQAGGIESIFAGLINEPAAKYDTSVSDSLQNHLFEFRNADGSIDAVDLLATNINRGRDHGIPPYTAIRERCGLGKTTDFSNLADVMSQDSISRLRNIYRNVNDIDYYVGGLFENQIPGGVVGPTFACIIANQFRDLKVGDRFYYENGPSTTAFTLDQLREIKKVTMARIICNDYEVGGSIQPRAFLLQNVAGNGKVSCNSLPRLDISKWRM